VTGGRPSFLEGEIAAVSFPDALAATSIVLVAPSSDATEERRARGRLGFPRAGERLRAWGEYRTEPSGERIFAIASHRLAPPRGGAALARYLSALSPGVDGALPAYLAQNYGLAIFDILENSPESLAGLVPPPALKALAAESRRARAVQRLASFLAPYDLGPLAAAALWSELGEGAPGILQEKPLLLLDFAARHFPGGVPALASLLGLAPDSPEIAKALLLEAFRQKIRAGRARLSGPALFKLFRSLPAPPAPLPSSERAQSERAVVARLVAEGSLKAFPHPDAALYYDPAKAAAFEAINKELARLATHPRRVSLEGAADIAPALPFPPNGAQKEALALARAHKALFLAGSRASGKSSLALGLARIYEARGGKVAFLAPTRAVAREIAARAPAAPQTLTARAFLGYRPEIDAFERGPHNPLAEDLAVLCRLELWAPALLARLLAALPSHASLLALGDPGLYPPGANPFAGGTPLFPPTFKVAPLPVSYFTRSRLLPKALSAFARGELTREPLGDPHLDYYFLPETDPLKIAAKCLRLFRERVPAKLGAEPSRASLIIAVPGDGPLSAARFNALLAPPETSAEETLAVGEISLQKGLRVILREDFPALGLERGDIGLVGEVSASRLAARALWEDGESSLSAPALMALRPAAALALEDAPPSFPGVIVPLGADSPRHWDRSSLYRAASVATRALVIVGDPAAAARVLAREPSF
jgi:hypothetical protein